MLNRMTEVDMEVNKFIKDVQHRFLSFRRGRWRVRFCLGLHVDDVEEQKVWNCNEAPLPLLRRGRWREGPRFLSLGEGEGRRGRRKAHPDPPQAEKAISAQSQIIEDTWGEFINTAHPQRF